ncbi:hypothetical protein V1290_000054 [Bradyrhizobium sp. AZCC 1578]|uniref:hypothetical protein n=1 Tax=Bradyrhizobium sp. AZCC 1578 TaxID=3117027 RepID=UPI002FF42D68
MALTITHAQVAGTGVDADAIVDGADWDANHTISGSVAASEVTSGAALTKTDDTNVTLTLGGGHAAALLSATSVTVGWTGTLALSRFYNASASRKILARQSAGAGVFEETTASSFLNVLYAEDYGVLASNTAAANDTAFSSLITAIGTGGKRVIFPTGKIQFSTALNLSSLTNVVFEGGGGLDLTYSGNFGTVLHFTGTGSGNIINMTNHRGLWWRDIQVVYSSNSFTGTVFNCSTTFTTGCASGFERVQVYQITNNGHTAGQCFYLKNNVDVTFYNVYVSHASYGWVGLFDGDATSPTNETNMIKLVNCTSIGLGSAAIVNPIIGWSCYGCNFELANSGAPAGFLATGAHTVTNLGLYGCVFADSTGAGTWVDLPVNIFNFTMIGGAVLTASAPSGTGMILGNTVCSGLVINGVLFSGLSTGISLSASGTIASIIGNEFLSTTTALSGAANLDATSIVIANNGLSPRAIAASAGGTGFTSYTTGDLLYADSGTTLAKLADVATGNALISGGVGTAPSWGKIGISTHVSGLGTGVATFLGTPSSANLASAVTDETGSGSLVFATNPTLPNGFVGQSTGNPFSFRAPSGGDVALVRYNSLNAGEAVGFGFQDAGSTKWTLGKTTANDFQIVDFANSVNALTITDGAASAGLVTVGYTTASSSSSTGALVVSGGVGVGGALHIGTPLAVSSGGVGVAAPSIYISASANDVDFNSVADTALTISLPSGYTRYRLQALMIYGASAAATSAQFALYTAAAAGGTAIVTPTTCTVNTASADTATSLQAVGPSINAMFTDTSLFFRITTAHGSAVTADVALQIQPLP